MRRPEIEGMITATGLDTEEVILVLRALARHRLLEMTAHPQTYVRLRSTDANEPILQLNRFGAEFVAACRPPSKAC